MRRSTIMGIAIAMAAAAPTAQPYAPNWMPDGRHILFQNHALDVTAGDTFLPAVKEVVA
jgi:hypothetical protein